MKPIHKFNNGQGATLCHQCNCIISLGHTDDLYCKEYKEIIHEVALEFAIDHHEMYETSNLGSMHFGFIEGAKWHQEQDKNKYNEEDLKEAFRVGFNVGYNDAESPSYLKFEEWIEQFKNK
jgi:hypothetical protein